MVGPRGGVGAGAGGEDREAVKQGDREPGNQGTKGPGNQGTKGTGNQGGNGVVQNRTYAGGTKEGAFKAECCTWGW